jgi:hypothetical protein
MTGSVLQTWHMACPRCCRGVGIGINANVRVRLCPVGTDVTLADNGDTNQSQSARLKEMGLVK